MSGKTAAAGGPPPGGRKMLYAICLSFPEKASPFLLEKSKGFGLTFFAEILTIDTTLHGGGIRLKEGGGIMSGMSHFENMMSASASCAEASFCASSASCNHTALSVDAILLASILLILGAVVLVCLVQAVLVLVSVLVSVLAVLLITGELNTAQERRNR